MNENNEKFDFEEDPRYKQCNKEALMGLALGIVNLVWWFGFGYGLGSKPVKEYTYIFGFLFFIFFKCMYRTDVCRITMQCIHSKQTHNHTLTYLFP